MTPSSDDLPEPLRPISPMPLVGRDRQRRLVEQGMQAEGQLGADEREQRHGTIRGDGRRPVIRRDASRRTELEFN